MQWTVHSVIVCEQMALQAGEREVSLSTRGHAYTIDFSAMQQIDDDTGSPSKVLRQEWDAAHSSSGAGELHKLFALSVLLLLVFVCLFNESTMLFMYV